MVRACRPPDRAPASSWLARRSTIATSTGTTRRPARTPSAGELLARAPLDDRDVDRHDQEASTNAVGWRAPGSRAARRSRRRPARPGGQHERRRLASSWLARRSTIATSTGTTRRPARTPSAGELLARAPLDDRDVDRHDQEAST